MENDYSGDMILIDRFAEFYEEKSFSWNKGEMISVGDITEAINNKHKEEAHPYGDTWKHPCIEEKTRDWHIGRVIYYINHPHEIKDIEIDNLYSKEYIFPVPVVIDGNHRVLAAFWLNMYGKLDKMHCLYGGRLDLLDYLTGETDVCPEE